MEDRVGQVWAKWYEDADLVNATIFIIVERGENYTNPHTGAVMAFWAGCVLSCSDDRPQDVGKLYVWNEDCFEFGGDSYDNVYERIT